MLRECTDRRQVHDRSVLQRCALMARRETPGTLRAKVERTFQIGRE